jgi:hypothetical protein
MHVAAKERATHKPDRLSSQQTRRSWAVGTPLASQERLLGGQHPPMHSNDAPRPVANMSLQRHASAGQQKEGS